VLKECLAGEVLVVGAQRADQQDNELKIGQFRRPYLALSFLVPEETGRREEDQQEPDDQWVGVDHPDHVEGQQFGQADRQVGPREPLSDL
jgi:hypothetical protein